MWFLKGPKGELIYLKRNSTILVGRIQGDIILRDDKSVSRNHASVIVQSKNEDKKSSCFVKDLEAKYGSTIMRGDEKIKITKEGIKVEHNDKIKFGLQNNDYIAYYIPTVVLVSSTNDMDNLESIIHDIDGYIVQEWTNGITHLTTSKAKLGVKIAMGLVNCIPIVGVEYWKAVQFAVNNNQDWPKTGDYILPITEDIIDNSKVSLAPNFDRKTLFKNLIFLFFSYSQFNIYQKIIKDAGGKSLMFNTSLHSDLKQFCSDEFIVVYYMIGANQTEESILESQRSKTAYEKIEDLLRQSKRRMVSDSEIMLALLHCSLEKNCNVKHNYKELLVARKTNVSKEKKKASIFALDTEDVRSRSSLQNNENIIAETNDFTSQDFRDTAWSAIENPRKTRPSSPGLSAISSIRYDSNEPSDDVENSFSKLTMDKKRSEKRSSDSINSFPVKKAKLDNNSLFPVVSKKNSQSFLNSQSSLTSQDTSFSQILKNVRNSRNSQLPREENDSVVITDQRKVTQSQNNFSQPSTSREKQSKPTKNIFGNWLENSKTDKVKLIEETRSPVKRTKTSDQLEKNSEQESSERNTGTQSIRVRSDNSLLGISELEKTNRKPQSKSKKVRETGADEMNVCDEPKEKRRRINARDDSSSVEINLTVERNDKRKRENEGADSDSNTFVLRKKQDSNNKNIFQMSDEMADDETNYILVSGLIRQSFQDPSLNDSCGLKIFQKNYKTIPRTRISRELMVPCGIEAE